MPRLLPFGLQARQVRPGAPESVDLGNQSQIGRCNRDMLKIHRDVAIIIANSARVCKSDKWRVGAEFCLTDNISEVIQ